VWELPIDANGRRTGNPIQLSNSRGILIHPALSPDGQNVAFVLAHSDRDELQVLNIKTQTLTSLNAPQGYIRHPVFSLDGSSIDFQTLTGAFEISIHGGTPSQIYPANGYVSDWSSDGERFLWVDGVAISLVDKATLKTTTILKLQDGKLFQAHFSPDGKYVTFNAHHHHHSQIYAAPLRTDAIPESDWIPLTDGTTWDDKPRISSDGKLLFFVSDQDGVPGIWLQRISADMRRVGNPEKIYASHLWRRSMSGAGLGDVELNVARDKLVFTQAETFGSVWVLDPPAGVKQ
jgi:Tol biopolymer transport system component